MYPKLRNVTVEVLHGQALTSQLDAVHFGLCEATAAICTFSVF